MKYRHLKKTNLIMTWLDLTWWWDLTWLAWLKLCLDLTCLILLTDDLDLLETWGLRLATDLRLACMGLTPISVCSPSLPMLVRLWKNAVQTRSFGIFPVCRHKGRCHLPFLCLASPENLARQWDNEPRPCERHMCLCVWLHTPSDGSKDHQVVEDQIISTPGTLRAMVHLRLC